MKFAAFFSGFTFGLTLGAIVPAAVGVILFVEAYRETIHD